MLEMSSHGAGGRGAERAGGERSDAGVLGVVFGYEV